MGSAKEEPLGTAIACRRELLVSNVNGLHININLFDHSYLTRYYSNTLIGSTGLDGQLLPSKKRGKDQEESMQSSTTPDPGYHMENQQKHILTPQTRSKTSVLFQQVTTRQQRTDAKA